jgi:replicative DNA helicase
VDQAEHLIFEVSRRFSGQSMERRLSDLLAGYLGKPDRQATYADDLAKVPTGFAELDRMTGGLQKGSLSVVLGPSNVGASNWTLSLTHQGAIHYEQRIGIVSQNMSQEQMDFLPPTRSRDYVLSRPA